MSFSQSPCIGLTRADHPLDDDEGEVVYLSLDLGAVDPALIPSCSSIRLAGLETPTPYVQLGDSVFRGLHATALGTELVFQNDATPLTVERKILCNPVQLVPRPTEAETESVPTLAPPEAEAQSREEPSGGARDSVPARRAGRPRGGRGRGRVSKSSRV